MAGLEMIWISSDNVQESHDHGKKMSFPVEEKISARTPIERKFQVSTGQRVYRHQVGGISGGGSIYGLVAESHP